MISEIMTLPCMLQAAVCSEAGSALRLFVKLAWTVAFNADFGVCATPVRPSCGWYPTVGGGESDVKLSYIFPCLRAGGEKLEVINCVCVRSSLIFPQGQLQPWTDRWLRGVHAF